MKRNVKIAIARIMAILMVLSVLPVDMLGAVVTQAADSAASGTKVYILDPEKLTESTTDITTSTETFGTDNYFTIMADSSKKAAIVKINDVTTGSGDSAKQAYNPLTWGEYASEVLGESGIANSSRTKCIRLTGGQATSSNNSIKITTTTANASLLVYSSPKDGTAGIQVLNSKGSKVATPTGVANPNVVKNTITLADAGTYYIGPGSSSGSNGGIILYMQVTENANGTTGGDGGDSGNGNTSSLELTYDAPIINAQASGTASFKSGTGDGEDVDTKKVHINASTLDENSVDASIKTAVKKASDKLMEESSNKDEGAEAIVTYYDFNLENKADGAAVTKLQLKSGEIKIKLPYPKDANIRLNNKILVMHEAEDAVEVQRTDKDSDGFWITASSFSPYTVIIEPTAATQAGKLDVYDQNGYAEGAYAEWDPYTGTGFSGYMAWVSKDNQKWDLVDDELIRYYGDHYRVDVLGLTEGHWYLKIQAVAIAVDNSAEAVAETTVEVNVTAHDRSGYAWVKGTSSGAYNENGSLIDGANVVYITEKTKDTVTLDVTTNSKGSTTTYTGIQGILDGYKKGYEKKPLDIRIIGNVTNASYLLDDDIVIENANGKNGSGGITVEGVGEDAVANGWGIRVKNASNVEIRNLGFMNRSSKGEKDNIGLQQDNDHVWVHHCDLFYGNAGSDADQIKGDGALDCKKSNYVTMSYNHFWDSGKCSLLGLKENSNEYYVTYHHNWFDHSDSRHPRIRFFTTHVYNNYYDGNAKYGVGGAKGGASIFVENNYFRNCKYPMLISMQGSDLWDDTKQQNVAANGTFSKEDGSIIKAYGNYMEGQKRFIPYADKDDPNTKWDETKEFDAYVAKTRDEKVPSTVKAAQGGWTYSNFDTASDFYKYKADPAEKVPEIVMNNAGRVNGGDFKWEFKDEADTSYLVDENLKAACMNYTSKLISVGGLNGQTVSVTYTVTFDPDNGDDTWDVEVANGQKVTKPTKDPVSSEEGKSFAGWYKGSAKWNFNNVVNGNMVLKALYLGEGEEPPFTGGGDDDLEDDDNEGGNVDPGEYIHNFTASGKTSNFYTISGNLSKDKGKVTYKELTLTQCLKMESSTSITFKAPVDGELTLVFGLEKDSAAGKNVKINGTAYQVGNNGILTHSVDEGTVEITRKDTMHLFYMEYVPDPNAAPAEKYVITVKPDNGDKDYTIKVDKGSQLTSNELKTPIRSGYVFQGWVDANGKSITLPYTPTGNMTIKATWKAVGGGSEDNPGGDTGSGDSWTVEMEETVYTYTGSAIKPAFTVYGYDGEVLVAGVDYTVKYSNNVNASVKANASGGYDVINAKKIPSVTITGKGNLTGKRTVEFEIHPADIGDATYGKIVIETGKKISTPVLYYNSVKLAAKDYDYADPADKSVTRTEDGKVVLLGKGNFEGDIEIPIQVVSKGQLKNSVGKFKVTVNSAQAKTLIYTGENLRDAIEECITVTATKTPDDVEFDKSKYVITLPEVVTEVGTVKFTVVGVEEFSGCSVTKSVKILPKTLTDSDVTVDSADKEAGVQYKSTGATLSDLKVTWQGEELTNGKDYKVAYSGNKKVGDAKYTVSFMGNFKGKLTAGTFKVNQAVLDMTNEDIDIVIPDKACKDKASCKSTPYVTINGVLVKSSEYKVTYRVGEEGDFVASPKAGEFGEAASKTVYVKIESKDKNYKTASGQELIGEYTIWKLDNTNKGKDLSKAKVTFYTKDGENLTKVTKLQYTGEPVEPDVVKVELKDGGTWVEVTDCEIVYANNVNKGKATVIVKPGADSGLIGSKVASFNVTAKNAGGLNATSLTSLIQSLFN